MQLQVLGFDPFKYIRAPFCLQFGLDEGELFFVVGGGENENFIGFKGFLRHCVRFWYWDMDV